MNRLPLVCMCVCVCEFRAFEVRDSALSRSVQWHVVGGRFRGAPTLGPVRSLGERRSEREKLGERRGGVRGQGGDVCEGWALVSGMASLVSGVPRLSRASFEGGGVGL